MFEFKNPFKKQSKELDKPLSFANPAEEKKVKESKSTYTYDRQSGAQIKSFNPMDSIESPYTKFKARIQEAASQSLPLIDKATFYESNRKNEDYPLYYDFKTDQYAHKIVKECLWFKTGKKRESTKLVTEYKKVKYSPNEIESCFTTELGILKESGKVKEGDSFDSSYNGYAGGPGVFLPLPPNDLMVQQYLQSYWQQAAEARWLYNNFEPVRGGVNAIANFVIGTGCKFQFKDKQAQVIWNEFQDRTTIQSRLFIITVGLLVYGESMLHLPEILVGGLPGYVRLWDRNPADCWEKITDTNNLEEVFAYYFNYPTRWLIQTVDGNPTSQYIIEMVPPDEMIHIKINSLEDEARGRSQIAPAFGSAKQLQDYIQARVIKAYNSACMVIDHKIEGNGTDVQMASQQDQSLIAPGVVVTHNDSESYDILKNDMGNDSKSGLHDELLSLIAIALGIPPVYLGASSSGGRAATLSQTDPAAKTFDTIRGVLQGSFKKLTSRVMDIAIKYGRLPKGTSTEVEIIFPELSTENAPQKITMLLQAQANGTLDHGTVSESIAKELGITTYDYAESQQLIKQQIAGNPQLDELFYIPESQVPKQAPGGQTTTARQQSANQSKSAYNGATMGLSDENKQKIKQSIESAGGPTNLIRLIESLSEAHTVHDKKAKTHILKTLRSRTKDTMTNSESIGATTNGALTTIGVKPEECSVENCAECAEVAAVLDKYKTAKIDPANAIESTPPDFPEDIKSKVKNQYPGNDAAAFATMWALRGKGYA